MALGDIFRIQSAEFINLIIQKNTVRHIAMIASVNRELNSIIMHSAYGKKIWLEIAGKITGYDAAQFINPATATHEMFFYHIKLLICPWISLPVTLPFEIPPVEGSNLQMDIAITSRNRLALRIEDDEEPENITGIYSMPCRPCDSSMFNIQCTRLPEDYPLPIPEPAPALTNKLAIDYFALEVYTAKSTQLYRVHDGVFAVMEFYETDISTCDADEFNGIYFFATEAPQRMLRHMHPAPFLSHRETDICFLPMEIWLLAHHRIWYFGPNTATTVNLAEEDERVDPALWLTYFGRAGEAVKYIHDHSIGINTTSLSQDKTMMHYAAMGGDVQTIRTLTAAGANINMRDSLKQSPLCTASRWLQADAVEELLRAGAVVHRQVFEVMGFGNDDGYYEEEAICGTVKALLDNVDDKQHMHLLFFNSSVVLFHSAMKMLIDAGIPTNKKSTGGHYALHFFLHCVNSDADAIPTISMFRDEDFQTKFDDGRTPLTIATDRELDVKIIEYIRGRIA